jgi:hypothetical protein
MGRPKKVYAPTKVCIKCHIEKDREEFPSSGSPWGDSRRNVCKPCYNLNYRLRSHEQNEARRKERELQRQGLAYHEGRDVGGEVRLWLRLLNHNLEVAMGRATDLGPYAVQEALLWLLTVDLDLADETGRLSCGNVLESLRKVGVAVPSKDRFRAKVVDLCHKAGYEPMEVPHV